VQAALKQSFFKKAPPKSTGRDEFSLELFRRLTRGVHGPDLVATATAITVESIGRAYDRWVLEAGLPLKAVFVCGGGANNSTLMGWIADRLPGIEVRSLEGAGFDPQLIEAQAFAFFGFLTLLGQPIGGSWTGAQGFGPPANILPGENWGHVLEKISAIREA
jgi:anhydro-N-acetylmuramic acid kinase